MAQSELALTEDDIRDLNRMSVERAAAFVRIGGAVVIAVGVVGALAWMWTVIRVQQEASPAAMLPFGQSQSEAGLSLVDRIDLLAPYAGALVIASAAVGFGLFLRLLADFVVDRIGGTTTGFEAGDQLDDPTVDALSPEEESNS